MMLKPTHFHDSDCATPRPVAGASLAVLIVTIIMVLLTAMALTGYSEWWIPALGALLYLWLLSLLFRARGQTGEMAELLNTRNHDLLRANIALRDSETRYRIMADNISDVVFTCNLGGIFTSISPSIRQLSGYRPEELLGATFYCHLDLPSAERAQDAFFQALTALQRDGPGTMVPATEEYLMLCSDNSRKPVESTLKVLLDDEGQPAGFIGVMRDLSDRRMPEKTSVSSRAGSAAAGTTDRFAATRAPAGSQLASPT